MDTTASRATDCGLCAAIQQAKVALAAKAKSTTGKVPKHLNVRTDVLWTIAALKSTLNICFVNGDAAIQKKVIDYAKLWTQSGVGANLTLVHLPKYDPKADIRVNF